MLTLTVKHVYQSCIGKHLYQSISKVGHASMDDK